MDASRTHRRWVSSEALAAILYTSGTTDRTEGRLPESMPTWSPCDPDPPLDTQFALRKETFLRHPLTHTGMTTAMNIPIAIGAKIPLLPCLNSRRSENLQDVKPTFFRCPSIYMAINRAPHVSSFRLSSIKACVSGAAPLRVEVQEALRNSPGAVSWERLG